MAQTKLNAFKMSKAQMNSVNGGISAREYCKTLYMIKTQCVLDEGANEGWNYGWNHAGCNEYVSEFQG